MDLSSIMSDLSERFDSLSEDIFSAYKQPLCEYKVMTKFKDRHPKPIMTDSQGLIDEVTELCPALSEYLETTPHLKALFVAHDQIASGSFDEAAAPNLPDTHAEVDEDDGVAVRIVRLIKNDEPLGVTIQENGGVVTIARVLKGGLVDRSGCVNVGDHLLEVNGVSTEGLRPRDIVRMLKESCSALNSPEQTCDGETCVPATICLKVLAAPGPPLSELTPSTCYNTCNCMGTCTGACVKSPQEELKLKALFAYEPAKDPSHPCPEAGLRFERGAILTLLSQEDKNWWQVRNSAGITGLVPSPKLLKLASTAIPKPGAVPHKNHTIHNKQHSPVVMNKTLFSSKNAWAADMPPTPGYEEVALLFPRPNVWSPLVLIGAYGAGADELKHRLLLLDSKHYVSPVPYTSRPPKNGEISGIDYVFEPRSVMEKMIKDGKFLEYGEYKGNIYGTTLESVDSIVSSGVCCVLTPHPQALRLLRTPALRPIIIFVKPPPSRSPTRGGCPPPAGHYGSIHESMTESEFGKMLKFSKELELALGHYVDYTLVNCGSLDRTFQELKNVIVEFSSKPRYVPKAWVL